MGSKDDWNHSQPVERLGLRSIVLAPRGCGPASGPLPRRVQEPRRLHQAACRPGRDPGYRHPVGHHPRVPELHRQGRRGHAAPQPRDPGDAADKASPAGLAGGDPAGFPNGRRVTDDVVTIELRAIAGLLDPAGRQVVHAGRRDQPGRRRLVDDADAERVPVPQHAARRIQRGLT